MGSIKTRLSNARSKLLRRGSHTSATTARSLTSSAGSEHHPGLPKPAPSNLRKSISLSKLPAVSQASVRADDDGSATSSAAGQRLSKSEVIGRPASRTDSEADADDRSSSLAARDRQPSPSRENTTDSSHENHGLPTACPELVIEEPTPISPPALPLPCDQHDQHARKSAKPTTAPQPEPASDHHHQPAIDVDHAHERHDDHPSELPARPSVPASSSSKSTPPGLIRRQSLVTTSNAHIVKTLLQPDLVQAAAVGTGPPTASDYFTGASPQLFNPGMMHRKIWVKLARPNASATLVQIREDDLVDDVRDMILRKYANSLGKSFDAPDVTLRIMPRSDTKTSDRLLGPEEEMCRTLDAYYPGGQTVAEALLIEVPQPTRRTPRPSPRPVYFSHHDDSHPYESQSEYFPPMPIANPSPAVVATQHDPKFPLQHPHSIAVLSTGNLPTLPSPGSTRRQLHAARPKYPRHNTASPTTLTGGPSASSVRPVQNRPRHDSSASETKHSASGNASIPTPPVPAEPAVRQNSTPPTPRVASPRPEKKKKKKPEPPSLPAGLLDGSVPPINVLIVEDNMINLRVLGAFMQRLKVRWQRAVNGKEAVEKWRAGGFHLVLMDIQLPLMNGLEATKEIRRLERINSIGVFSSGSNEAPNNRLIDGRYDKELSDKDKLGDKSLFKSPVIIVALTASSLQSDRHEALAAGCNDFLTKPVNFVWLERKVKEWGCMQALIDFDGWRKWKDFAAGPEEGTSTLSASFTSYAPRSRAAPAPGSAGAALSPGTAQQAPVGAQTNGTAKEEEKKGKRKSLGVGGPLGGVSPAVKEDVSASASGSGSGSGSGGETPEGS